MVDISGFDQDDPPTYYPDEFEMARLRGQVEPADAPPFAARAGERALEDAGLNAERQTLGALMQNQEDWNTCKQEIGAFAFSMPLHQDIWRAIDVLHDQNEPINQLSVEAELFGSGAVKDRSLLPYIGDLVRRCIQPKNALNYARILRKHYERRQLASITHRTAERARAGQDATDVLKKLDDELRALRADLEPQGQLIQLIEYSTEEIMGPVEKQKYLLPGVPEEVYTLLAGAASASKTTYLFYLLLWKATGFDILGLDPDGPGVTPGKALMLTYEEPASALRRRLQIVAQHYHSQIVAQFGSQAAEEFHRLRQQNFRACTLREKADCGITKRDRGAIVPNEAFLGRLQRTLAKWGPDGVTIGLDPLRLAVMGSQNDDDGADTAVQTLNRISAFLPHSGVVVVSHATKADAKSADDSGGRASAIYATAGSGLYSQHARSNFSMNRLPGKRIQELFRGGELAEKEIQKELVSVLTHGRDSNGEEQGQIYFALRSGRLERIKPTQNMTSKRDILADAVPILESIERLHEQGLRASGEALAKDPQLKVVRAGLRQTLLLLTQNEFIKQTGATKDRDLLITEKGRELLGADRRES